MILLLILVGLGGFAGVIWEVWKEHEEDQARSAHPRVNSLADQRIDDRERPRR